MKRVILATEYPLTTKQLTEWSDDKLLALHKRMVTLNQDFARDMTIGTMDSSRIALTIVRSQYWGRVAYELLKEREIPVVKYFSWDNNGELYKIEKE